MKTLISFLVMVMLSSGCLKFSEDVEIKQSGGGGKSVSNAVDDSVASNSVDYRDVATYTIVPGDASKSDPEKLNKTLANS